jgi:hypothetical protein
MAAVLPWGTTHRGPVEEEEEYDEEEESGFVSSKNTGLLILCTHTTFYGGVRETLRAAWGIL